MPNVLSGRSRCKLFAKVISIQVGKELIAGIMFKNSHIYNKRSCQSNISVNVNIKSYLIICSFNTYSQTNNAAPSTLPNFNQANPH